MLNPQTHLPAVRHGYVPANGVRLHFAAAGEGPLMLFLHGFPEFWYEWKKQLAEFGKDHLAVAPDLPGYNLSEKPADPAQYRVTHLVQHVFALAEQFREERKFTLVGHDWGGVLAWALAMARPECLENLVVVNAPHPAIFARLLATDAGQQQASQYMLLFRSARAEEMLSANGYGLLVENMLGNLLRSGALGEADKAAYLEAWSQPGALTGGLNYYRANQVGPPVPAEMEAQIGRSAAGLGLAPEQMKVRVPTLVIWGEQDTALTVRNLDGLEEFVPELTVRRVQDGTHWVIHEKPDEVNGYIRDFIR